MAAVRSVLEQPLSLIQGTLCAHVGFSGVAVTSVFHLANLLVFECLLHIAVCNYNYKGRVRGVGMGGGVMLVHFGTTFALMAAVVCAFSTSQHVL